MPNSDWEKLTPEQQKDVDAVRDRMCRHLIAETEAFYVQHPELRLMWSFNCDALLRPTAQGILTACSDMSARANIPVFLEF